MRMKVRGTSIEIGAFEAKNRLSELLRMVEGGRSVVITRHGRAVARLVPAADDAMNDLSALGSALRELRDTVDGTVDVRRLVEEGRRT
jgi:prevent-host-death family protein